MFRTSDRYKEFETNFLQDAEKNFLIFLAMISVPCKRKKVANTAKFLTAFSHYFLATANGVFWFSKLRRFCLVFSVRRNTIFFFIQRSVRRCFFETWFKSIKSRRKRCTTLPKDLFCFICFKVRRQRKETSWQFPCVMTFFFCLRSHKT